MDRTLTTRALYGLATFIVAATVANGYLFSASLSSEHRSVSALAHSQAAQATARDAQLQACHRLNVERARNNRDWYRTYVYDHTFLQLVIAGLRHQTSQVRRTAEQEHATKLFISKLRDNVRALQWIGLTDCPSATDHPFTYVPPSPVPFSQERPPPTALHLGPGN